MNKYLKICLFGVIIWLIPFLFSFFIWELHDSNRPLFESLMPVVLTSSVVVMAILHYKKLEKGYFSEGILIGILWFVINILIDMVMFLPESPMQMSFTNYMMDIGLTYLIIPIVAIGIGYIIEKKQ